MCVCVCVCVCVLRTRARPQIHTGKLDVRGAPHFNSSLLSRDSVKYELGSGRLPTIDILGDDDVFWSKVFWSKGQGGLRSKLLLSAARVSLRAPTTCRGESKSERARAREREREHCECYLVPASNSRGTFWCSR